MSPRATSGGGTGLSFAANKLEKGERVERLSGPNAALAALAGRRRVRRVLVARESRSSVHEALVAAAAQRGVPLLELPRRSLDGLAGHSDHQGVVVEVEAFPYDTLDALLERAVSQQAEPALIVVADSVQDPQNLGALARTAEVVGAHGMVLPEHRAVGVTPAVVRASAGAVELLPVARVTNLPRALGRMQEAGLWVAGLEADGEQLYDEADLTAPLALVVGGEDRGLGRLVRRACDLTLRLPMRGRTGSLNLGVAAGVVLYEACRQRQRGRAGAGSEREGERR